MADNNQNLTKTDLAEFAEETLLPAVGKIVDDKLEEKLEEKLAPVIQRLNSIENELTDIKVQLERIDKRTDGDIKANYQEIEQLKKRIDDLEEQVKVLKLKNA